jgi:hypothetical protein
LIWVAPLREIARIRTSAVIAGASVALVTFVGSLALVLALTRSYRSLVGDLAAADTAVLAAAALVLSAALGGFTSGIASKSAAGGVGAMYGSLSFIVQSVVLLVIAIASASAGALPSEPAFAAIVALPCALIASAIAGRSGAAHNGDDDDD